MAQGRCPGTKQVPWLVLQIVALHLVAWSEQPSSQANASFSEYAARTEARLEQPHGLPLSSAEMTRVKAGELLIDEATPKSEQNLKEAMIHDWRGAVFIPGVTAERFEELLRDYDNYPRYYAPEVRSARVLVRNGNHEQIVLRLQQKRVITVVLDAAYEVTFDRCDAKHGFSRSQSNRVDEIGDPGGANEHELSAGENHGFLWRQNTYWAWLEADGGLYIQVEAVSLTRSIPNGLAWAVEPFVESVARDSLEFTLRATRNALKKQSQKEQQ